MKCSAIASVLALHATSGYALHPKRQENGASPTAAATSSYPSSTGAASGLDQSLNLTIDGKIFPPAINTADVNIPQDFTVNCVKCSINGAFNVDGGDETLGEDAPPSIFQTAGDAVGFDFTELWVGAIVDNLTAHFEFAVNLTASNDTNELTIPLYSLSKSTTYDGITFTATFSPEIHGWINTTKDVNFTHGFDFAMQPGAGLLIAVHSLEKTQTYEFNQSTLTPLPYTATTGDIDMSFELSFRPKFDFLIDVLNSKSIGGGELSTYFDVPKLDVQVSEVHNVGSNCDPAPGGSTPDHTYASLIKVVPSIGFDASAVFSAEEVGNSQSSPPYQASWTAKNLSTACLAFNEASKTLGPVTQAGKSGATTSSASTVHDSSLGLLFVTVFIAFTVFLLSSTDLSSRDEHV